LFNPAFARSLRKLVPLSNEQDSKQCSIKAINKQKQKISSSTTKPTHPTSVPYREIAQVLVKKNELPYNPTIKKKDDLFVWFSENWHIIEQQFLVLLGARMRNATEDR
jgi:hypothetical protein